MKAEDKEQLSAQELQVIYSIIFQSRWSGDDWKKTIAPLLRKIERMMGVPASKWD